VGQRFGCLSDDAELSLAGLSDRLSGGGRLAVLSPSLVGDVLPGPADAAGDGSDSERPVTGQDLHRKGRLRDASDSPRLSLGGILHGLPRKQISPTHAHYGRKKVSGSARVWGFFSSPSGADCRARSVPGRGAGPAARAACYFVARSRAPPPAPRDQE